MTSGTHPHTEGAIHMQDNPIPWIDQKDGS